MAGAMVSVPSFLPWASRAAFVAAALGAMAGCETSEKSVPFALAVRVEGDPGRPLRGADVSFLGQRVGTTGDSGTVVLTVRGVEGEHIPVAVACPEGFQSPSAPTDVVLHRLAEPGRRPEYDISCVPKRRHIVVVVRADRGPNLPVLYLGREVARTDESGAAHALVEAPANEDVEIGLGTNEAGDGRLRPQNPSMKFVASDTNEIKVFSVQFEIEADKRRAGGPRTWRPVRLN
jgi:hypothetical protein